MQVDNFALFTSSAMTGDLHSKPIPVEQFDMLSIQAVWTGTPAGTFTIETSNDVGTQSPDGTVTGISTWSLYTGSSQAAGGVAGNFSWHFSQTPFKWARLSYAFSGSTGSLTARVQQKAA